MSTVRRRSPLTLGQRGEPGAQIGLHVHLARRLDQQPPAVAAADHGDRRLGRAQHLDALGRRARGGRPRGRRPRPAPCRVPRRPARRAGRTAAAAPAWRMADLALEERLAVAGDDRLPSPGARACASARSRGPATSDAAGAARHLMQQLERALAGARVGAWPSPRSPSTMPTVARSGKWWPLATICVPMMMSASPASMLLDDLAHLGQAGDEVGRQQRQRAPRGSARPPPRRCARRRGRRRPACRARRTSGTSRAAAARSRNGGS